MRVSQVLFLLACATLAVAKKAAKCQGLFVGIDTSDPEAEGEAIYRDAINYPMAAASIMTFFGKVVNISPSSQAPAELAEALNDLPYNPTIDGFRHVRLSHRLVEIENGLDSFEQTVRKVYDPFHDGIIAKTLSEMIPKSISVSNSLSESNHKDKTVEWTLCIVGISKETVEQPTFIKLLRIPIKLKTDQDGQVVAPPQYSYLIAADYIEDSLVLQKNAQQFASMVPAKTVSEFKKYFTSKATTDVDATPKDNWWRNVDGQNQIPIGSQH
ncbi:hypothetical protein BGW41_005205 [Actinomortierella wolfii]|nr:hypothetical protein BGW41_005205 [Actinomortierella wolfii]